MVTKDEIDYKKRYENLCREIKKRSWLLKQAFNDDTLIDRTVVTTTQIYDDIVDRS
jgi:hypothetical protein